MAIDLSELIEDFNFFDDWEDRYRYIIDLGKKLPAMPTEEMVEENKVRGCMSQVWMTSRVEGDPTVVRFNADSDAFIVKGLIAVLMQIYDGQSPKDIAETDAMEALRQIGLESHISPNRRNGLVAMVERIRNDALKFQN